MTISILIKARTICYIALYNVLIYESLDIYIVVSRPHVIQAVAVGNNTIAAVVQKHYAVSAARKKLTVGKGMNNLAAFSCYCGCAVKVRLYSLLQQIKMFRH